MTKEEAKKIIETLNTVDALEALGLIKFDEISQEVRDCLAPNFGSFAGVDAVLKALNEAGYEIIKKR